VRRESNKYIIRSIIALASLLGSKPALAYSHFPTLDKSVRLHQAKELLGSHYDKSIVKNGEKFRHIEEFIFQEVKDSLKDPWKPEARRLARAIMNESVKYAFDPIFLMAVIKHESVFNPETRGSFGEIGLMQIKPSTAQWISKKYEIHYNGAKSLFDPVVNVKFGAAYLDYLRDRFSAQSRLYLAAYNMGVTNVHRAMFKDKWPKDYPIKVMQRYVEFYAELVKSRTPDSKVLKPLVLADSNASAPSAF
jgi:soluble lytic murein transglycosylase